MVESTSNTLNVLDKGVDMKSLKRKNEQGFTLVELMIVVAIIGVLSAVAIPNFKKYQAKAKTSEAKVQLAAAYTALQAFYGDYGVYSTCLAYMGYDPGNEYLSRYYAIGFGGATGTEGLAATVATVSPAGSANMDANALASAQNSGLGVECQNAAAFPIVAGATAAQANVGNVSHFPAGKRVGGSAPQATITAAFTKIGSQATGNQHFVIAAEGTVSTDRVVGGATGTGTNSVFQMDHRKITSNTRSGY